MQPPSPDPGGVSWSLLLAVTALVPLSVLDINKTVHLLGQPGHWKLLKAKTNLKRLKNPTAVFST